MILKLTVLVVAAFIQADLSQGQQHQQPQPYQQPYGYQQVWDPSSWYTAAASNNWMDYIKKAAEVSQQVYRHWDKGAAANMFNTGMGLAQYWAAEAQKAAALAMKEAQNGGNGAFQ